MQILEIFSFMFNRNDYNTNSVIGLLLILALVVISAFFVLRKLAYNSTNKYFSMAFDLFLCFAIIGAVDGFFFKVHFSLTFVLIIAIAIIGWKLLKKRYFRKRAVWIFIASIVLGLLAYRYAFLLFYTLNWFFGGIGLFFFVAVGLRYIVPSPQYSNTSDGSSSSEYSHSEPLRRDDENEKERRQNKEDERRREEEDDKRIKEFEDDRRKHGIKSEIYSLRSRISSKENEMDDYKREAGESEDRARNAYSEGKFDDVSGYENQARDYLQKARRLEDEIRDLHSKIDRLEYDL